MTQIRVGNYPYYFTHVGVPKLRMVARKILSPFSISRVGFGVKMLGILFH